MWALPDQLVTTMTLDGLEYVPSANGFSENKISLLIQHYGIDFLNVWNTYQLRTYASTSAVELFKLKGMPSPLQPLYPSYPVLNPTWLQVLFSSPGPLSNATFVANFSQSTVWGFTPTQASFLSDETVIK